MKRFFARMVVHFGGDEPTRAKKPLIAGYRQEMAPGWRVLVLAVLAVVAFVYGAAFGNLAPAATFELLIPIAALAGLVIWALPQGDYAPTRLIEPLFMAFFAALLLWPNYLAIALPGLPWLTMLRITGAPLIATLLVCISVSSVFRARLWDVINTDRAIIYLLVGVVVMQTLTIPLSREPEITINRWFVAQINLTAIFFVSCVVFMRKGFAEYWIRIFLLILTVLCGIGFWEASQGGVLWAGHIPSFIRIDDPIVNKILAGGARAATGIYRVQSTSTTSLSFAEVLGLSIPFAIYLSIGRYHVFTKLLSTIYIPVAIWVIILTNSRLGMVATLASIVFYLLFWGMLSWKHDRKNIFAPLIVLAFPVIFFVVFSSTLLIGRLRRVVWGDGSQNASNDARIEQWNLAIPKIIRNPIGNGIGQGGDVLGYVDLAGFVSIDSYYLSALIELGVVGFICFFGLFCRGVFISSKTLIERRDSQEIAILLPISVSLINFIIVKAVLSQDANHPLAFIMMGAIVALIYRARQERNALNPPEAGAVRG